MASVKLEKIVEKMKLENLTPELDISKIKIKQPDINRPALPMALPVSRATFSVPWTMSLAPRVMGLPLRAVLLALSAALPAGVLLALVFPFRFSSG